MKKVVGIPFYDKQIAEENKRVKNLAPNSFWCDGNVKDDNLYWSSSVDKLPGVQGAKKRLLEEGGFTTIEDLRDINQPQKKQKLLGLKGIGKKTIDNFAIAITSVVGDKPAETPVEGTDHRKSEFPYLSKFKTQELADMKMKKSVTLNPLLQHKRFSYSHIYRIRENVQGNRLRGLVVFLP